MSKTMSKTKQNNLLDHALRYRGLGWSLIPLLPGEKKPAKGFSWKKYTKERPRRRVIEGWFKSAADVAVVLGDVSGGLACRDFDEADAYHRWAADHPDLAETLPTARTPRGYHVYFMVDGGDAALADAKSFINFDDGELRLKDCYCKLPPSRHDGGRYEWRVVPYHGVPMVHSVIAAGLVPADFKTAFPRARARDLDTSICKHIQRNRGVLGDDPLKGWAKGKRKKTYKLRNPLFSESGELDKDVFDAVFERTIPKRQGDRNHNIWQACRLLKSFDETRMLPIDELSPIIKRWFQLALPKIGTEDFAITLADFAVAWKRVKTPFSQGADMNEILNRARAAGCPARIRPTFGMSVAGLVAAICRQLAIKGGGKFYLDVRTLGGLVNKSKNDAAAYLTALQASRVIRRLTEPQRGRACTYRYLLSLDE